MAICEPSDLETRRARRREVGRALLVLTHALGRALILTDRTKEDPGACDDARRACDDALAELRRAFAALHRLRDALGPRPSDAPSRERISIASAPVPRS